MGRDGAPLDVQTPLRNTHDHATKAVVAWLLAFAAIFWIATSFPSLFGWPQPRLRAAGEVVAIEAVRGGTRVTFAGRAGGRDITWWRLVEENEWTLGEPDRGWVDEDGR